VTQRRIASDNADQYPVSWSLLLIMASGHEMDIVVQVGNYGESFNRHLGKDSPIKLRRGLNDLWTEGGLMYAMPFR